MTTHGSMLPNAKQFEKNVWSYQSRIFNWKHLQNDGCIAATKFNKFKDAVLHLNMFIGLKYTIKQPNFTQQNEVTNFVKKISLLRTAKYSVIVI